MTALIDMIDTASGGGENPAAIMPSVLLEETQFFFTYNNIVNSERARVRKFKKDKD